MSDRLCERFSEIEQAALTIVFSEPDPAEAESTDPEYLAGLRAAVSAVLAYGIEALARSGDRPAPIPVAPLAQARLAARYGVSLEAVLRRHVANYTLLGDFVLEESEKSRLHENSSPRELLRAQAAALDRLLAAVGEEYAREARARLDSGERRRLQLVEKLLAGEPADTADLAYDFDAHHLGAVADGPMAAEALRKLSTTLDCRLLLVGHGEDSVWAWLGGQSPTSPEDLERALRDLPTRASIAIGEPAAGIAGWRLTHRQAKAALSVAKYSEASFVRYAEAALVASVLQDDLLTISLRRLYVAPLSTDRNGGATLHETLRAYFRAAQNASSAAAALGVSRQTVNKRLRAIEERIGRRIDSCSAELEVALRLHELTASKPSSS